jgi:hypothetical protein
MPTYSSTQLVSAIKKRAKKAKQVAGEIYGNVKYNKLKGADLRMMRGGPGDALLNTDKPNARLVQKQMGQVQKAAAKDNLKAVGLAAAGPSIVSKSATALTARAFKKTLKSRASGKFISRNLVKRAYGKLRGK